MKEYIQSDTLAVDLKFDENLKDGTEIDLLENKVNILVNKV